jgi:hypothetical protein
MWGNDECDCVEAPKGKEGPIECICVTENNCICNKICKCTECLNIEGEDKVIWLTL